MKRYILSLLVLAVSLTATAQTSDKETFARNHELAQLGDPTAMYNVGKGYFDGRGVAKDHGEAFKWFLKAAQMNNVSAIEMVAYMYGYGDGTDSTSWNKSTGTEKELKWVAVTVCVIWDSTMLVLMGSSMVDPNLMKKLKTKNMLLNNS